MWINLDQAVMQVARVDPPIRDSDGRWIIRIADMAGREHTVRYNVPAAADMAFNKFRQFVLRGKTDAGNFLFIWPRERMASDLSAHDLDFIARQTQEADNVTLTDEECGKLSWRINGLP